MTIILGSSHIQEGLKKDFISEDLDINLGLNSGAINKKILHVLVYEAHGFRILLELFFAFIILSTIFLFFPSVSEGPISLQVMVVSIVCLAFVAIDSEIICSSCNSTRKAFVESLSGNYDQAISLYRKAMHAPAPPSTDLYLLALAEIFALKGERNSFNNYIAKALDHGCSKRIASFYYLRGSFFSNELTDDELLKIEQEFINDPMIQTEVSFIYLVKGRINSANVALKRVMESRSCQHLSGLETRDFSLLIQLLLDLISGNEEAGFDLDIILKTLKKEIDFIPTLAPYVSLCYLIRSRYYRKNLYQKDLSYYDQQRALSLCQYPLHIGFFN